MAATALPYDSRKYLFVRFVISSDYSAISSGTCYLRPSTNLDSGCPLGTTASFSSELSTTSKAVTIGSMRGSVGHQMIFLQRSRNVGFGNRRWPMVPSGGRESRNEHVLFSFGSPREPNAIFSPHRQANRAPRNPRRGHASTVHIVAYASCTSAVIYQY